MAAKLKNAGFPVVLKLYGGVTHALVIGAFARPLRGLAPVLDDVVAFIERAARLGPRADSARLGRDERAARGRIKSTQGHLARLVSRELGRTRRQLRHPLRELARRRHAEVSEQRLPIEPALEEDQAQAVVGIDGDAVLETPRLGARASDVLEAEAAQLVDAVEARLDGTGDYKHAAV